MAVRCFGPRSAAARLLLAAAALSASLIGVRPALASPSADVDVDVLVYGGTAAGIAAGIAAANGAASRHSVLVLERLPMLGGMAVAGGVGLMNNEQGVYGQGIGGRWCALNGRYYNASSTTPNCFAESHVGEASFWTMVNGTANLTLTLGCRLVSAARGGGACLASASFLCANDAEPLTVTARAFIDASYDGDLMVAAGGVSYAAGREASSAFNESLAGVSSVDEPNESFDGLNISPFWPDGSLLRGISPEPLPPEGADAAAARRRRRAEPLPRRRAARPPPTQWRQLFASLLAHRRCVSGPCH